MPKTNINLFNGQINCGVMMVERPIDQKAFPDLRELGIISIAHTNCGARISFSEQIPPGVMVKIEPMLGKETSNQPRPNSAFGLTIPGDMATVTNGTTVLTLVRQR